MKKFFDEEISMDEIKKAVNKLKHKENNNKAIIVASVFGIVLVVAGVIFAIIKCKNNNCDCDYDDDDDYEDFCDENGCYYTEEEDFEK